LVKQYSSIAKHSHQKDLGHVIVQSIVNFVSKLNNLDKYKERMKDTVFHSMDWKAVVNKYDSPSSLFYLDPLYEDSEKLYVHGVIDMVDLHNTLSLLKRNWVLSLNYNPDLVNIFSDIGKVKLINIKGRADLDTGKDRKKLLIYKKLCYFN
jgi:DNA adenine methylase